MNRQSSPLANDSPFHKGEQAIQQRLGVRDKMERFGQQVIRDFMPPQHQEFYNQLPFVFVGHADNNGWPWASILYNPPGFMQARNRHRLQFNVKPVAGDPLNDAIAKGVRLGVLGIELPTRRRNRLSGHINEVMDEGFELAIEQTFGNCPQYIQTRELEQLEATTQRPPAVDALQILDGAAIKLIENSDTFFVASYLNAKDDDVTSGVDVSHRGGRPGFVRVDSGHTLTIPDYLGNFHFNTLGNFLENPKAGLLFIDFENGQLLTLTGTTEVLFDSDEVKFFKGAERLWRFKIDHGFRISNTLPFRWRFGEYSQNSQLTGTWREADAIEQTEQRRDEWQRYRVVDIEQESSVIKSFFLQPENGLHPTFEAGQFLTVKAKIDGAEQIRTYTLSSAPGDDHYRISVKREQQGAFSRYLHDQIAIDHTLEVKAPNGAFTFDSEVERPAVLISGGIGITPMVSIARHALIEAVRTRAPQSLVLINAARNSNERAFFNELDQLAKNSSGFIQSYWALEMPEASLQAGKDYHHLGRINKALIQALLPLDDYDCYLCGPSPFMQAIYDILISLGISDQRIYAEAFGPAALIRSTTVDEKKTEAVSAAQEAIIEFSDSKVEQAWSQGDGTLLEFSESHGFTPEFSCRSGQCGMCKTKLISGAVTYPNGHSVTIAEDELLLCCAAPAAVEGELTPKVSIKL